MSKFAEAKAKLNDLFATFGALALGVWFTLFFATWGGFYLAIRAGFSPEGALAGAGTLGAAYAATQVTKPARIVATVVVTPVLGGIWSRMRGLPDAPPPGTPSMPHAKPSSAPSADATPRGE